jgi:leucyl aminopeptidase (aminopeptidase T)
MQMNTIEKAARFTLLDLLEMKPGQSLLVASEPHCAPMSQTFRKVAASEHLDPIFLELPAPAKRAGQLSEVFRRMMQAVEKALVIHKKIDPATVSYLRAQTHTRVALLAGADEDSLRRCLEVNHKRLAEHCRKLADILTIGRSLKLTSENGTDLKLSVTQMRGAAESAPLNGALACGSVPPGRAYVAPVANSAQGVIVLNTVAGQRVGSSQPIHVKIRDGKIAQIKGGRAAQVLRQLLRLGGDAARLLVEIGFGLNDKAKLGHSDLEDEKVLGTAHIGFGDLSGPAKSPAIFARGIISAPCLTIDGQKIIHAGRLAFA